MRDLNLRHLQAFTDVVELGSFSAAAERLNLTQPAVSLQLRQLESRLGVRLIERIGPRATPTVAGSALLDHVHRIEAAVADALDAMAHHRAETIGRVRLGTGATACIYLLPPLLRRL
ncbi:MAG: LysR family transcriptional regulator, partial [Alphaproteobacteria bacterium]|nr:LysR family transcriptional regulator [Alphaproteobacteria bacterium]